MPPITEIRKAVKQWFNTKYQIIQTSKGRERFVLLLLLETRELVKIHKSFFAETIAKNRWNNHLLETIETAKKFEQWMPYAIFIKKEDGKHHPYPFSVYHATFNNKNIEFKVKEDGCVYMMRLI